MLKKINYFLPTLSQSWVIVFYMLFIGSILAVPVTLVFSANDVKPPMWLLYIIPFIPPFLYAVIKGKKAAEKGLTKPVAIEATNLGSINPLIFGAICIAATLSWGVVLEPLTAWIPMPDSFKKLFEELTSNGASSFITAAILAPILEEYFLRGIITRGLFYNGKPLRAILWGAAIFAIIHMNPWQAISAFIIGIFLGWVYWRTHSLLAVIFIHFVNNGTAVLISNLLPDMEGDTTYLDVLTRYNAEQYYIPLYILALAIVAGSIYVLNKQLPKNNFNIATQNLS